LKEKSNFCLNLINFMFQVKLYHVLNIPSFLLCNMELLAGYQHCTVEVILTLTVYQTAGYTSNGRVWSIWFLHFCITRL
jgi:hypothetical protein